MAGLLAVSLVLISLTKSCDGSAPAVDWLVTMYPPEWHLRIAETDDSRITGYEIRTKTFDVWSAGPWRYYDEIDVGGGIDITNIPPRNKVQHYSLEMRGVLGTTYTEWSPGVSFWIQSNKSEPDVLFITSNPQSPNSHSYTLTWEVTLEGRGVLPIIGYRIKVEKITEPFPWNDVPVFDEDVFMEDTEYTFTGLDANSLYEVTIMALNVLKYRTDYSNYLPTEGLRTVFRFNTK